MPSKAARFCTKFSSVLKIADYFNVSTDYLLGRTEYTCTGSHTPETSTKELSPEEESLIAAYRSATDRNKSIVDAVLQPKVCDEEKEVEMRA